VKPTITPEMIRLYDDYTHLSLDRRRFLRDLARAAGGTAAAMAALPLLENNYAQAAIVAPDDQRLVAETVTFAGGDGEMKGYLVRPAGIEARLPAVLVIHENRGLNPHIEDVARRAALAGFLVLAADFLSPLGGTPADEDKAREMISALDADRTVANAVAAIAHLAGHPSSSGKVGAIGFCWGGGLVNQTAIHAPDLAAAVAFYGRVPEPADVAWIKARLLLHYAGLDERINQGVPGFRAALDAAGIDYALHVYEGVNHAFHNDTNAARYDKAAADLAWRRTIDFLAEALKG
jgi:carboxymethylenebutenolidase